MVRNFLSVTLRASHACQLVASFLYVLTGGLAITSAYAQFAITEINPTRSTLDATDPDGASGGRVNGLAAVASNNNIFYAASEWGGLYKSLDRGLTWVRLDGHLPTVTWDVEVSPANPNLVIATSFYDGRVTSRAGINVSTDGGNTWTHPATATPPVGFCQANARRDESSAFGISFDSGNPQNVYVGTNCGLAISNDSGANWRFVDPTPANGANNVWDVIVHHAGIIDTCGDDGHRRSTDGGTTWTSAAATGTPLPAGICSLAVSPDESYVLFATVGTSIFESDDGGGTWNTAFANPSAQGRVPFVAVNNRTGRNFDLWFGDTSLHRAACTTPAAPAAGGAARCPQSNTWAGPFTRSAGAHDDAGVVVFDTQPAARTVIEAGCSQSCRQQRDACMAQVGEPGGPRPQECIREYGVCLRGCPRQTIQSDACPMLFSSDGGVYFNTKGTDPDCHTPAWEQPNVTPRSLWLFGMSGADRAGATNEGLFFGNQDTGTFASSSAGSAAPSWTNVDCCDGFDNSADTARVLYTMCCFGGGGRLNRLFVRDANMAGGAEINRYPAGNLPGFTAVDILDRFGSGSYVLGTTAGVFITTNVAASPVIWPQLGAAPAGVCGVKASLSGTTPTFIAQVGGCSGSGQDQLWRYVGTASTGNWQQINPAGGVGGFGIFDIDPTNPNRILASVITATNVQTVLSNNGGTTWTNLTALDTLMTGNAAYRYLNTRGPTNFTGFNGYAQPTLVAFSTDDANTLAAGAADAGLFISQDNGNSWRTITDNSGPPNNPHIPRPQFAYFDREGGQFYIYVGTQGRGVWRISYPDPDAHLTVTKALVPATDPGRFDLRIDGVTQATNVGNGGSTGSVVVMGGTHTVDELGNGTSLSSYVRTFSGDCDAHGSVTLAAGDHKTCTITNRKDIGPCVAACNVSEQQCLAEAHSVPERQQCIREKRECVRLCN